MQGNRRPYYRTIKGKPTHLKPKIVMKEIHGQVVPVKVYPAQYAKEGDKRLNTSTEQKR